MSVLDRIGSLRTEAEAAVAGALSSAALEELRVRYLGRKAELPNLLRGVAQLPPEERGTVGRAANQARQGPEGPIPGRAGGLGAGGRGRVAGGASPTPGCPPPALTSLCPASRRSPSGACTCSRPPGASSRTSSWAWASPWSRARRSTRSTTTSTPSTTARRT